jgi:hypothetical protein
VESYSLLVGALAVLRGLKLGCKEVPWEGMIWEEAQTKGRAWRGAVFGDRVWEVEDVVCIDVRLIGEIVV